MPHIAETYALQAGLKLDEPYVPTKFFPLDIDKYIVICNSSGMASKNYDHFNEVMLLLLPNLDKLNIKVVQIGQPDDLLLINTIDYRGKTNITQLNYIIKNCALYIGNDSFGVHVAGSFKRPLIALYAVNYKELSRPFWCDNEKTVLIESDRGGLKPSFSAQESPKTINLIKPEQIAQAAANLLKFDLLDPIETISIGPFYNQASLETIPSQVVAPTFFNGILHIRFDHGGEEANVYHQLTTCKCNIVTPKPLDINILTQLKANVALVSCIVDDTDMLQFIKELKIRCIQYAILSYKQGADLNNLKLKYMHLGIIQSFASKKLEDIKNHHTITPETFVQTKRLLLVGGKTYAGKSHWLHDKPCASLTDTIVKVIYDDPEFWRDSDWYWLFNKK